MEAASDDPKGEFWAALKRYSQTGDNARGGVGSARKDVEAAARNLAKLPPEAPVYSSKLTPASVNNQVWQGRSVSTPNDLMVFEAWDLDKALVKVRERLSPRLESGFDAVVVARQTSRGGWQVHHVVEYDASTVGERLRETLGAQFPVTKVSDPAHSEEESRQDQAWLPRNLEILPEEITAGEVALHLSECPNVVLEGPPGTGKTRLALEVAGLIAGAPPDPYRLETVLNGRAVADAIGDVREAPLVWEIVQFHPGFGYEEFVRALRTDPEAATFTLASVDGILPKMAQIAFLRGHKPTLLIIDEINRANLSAVLGETIFAIDPAHRGESVRLQLPAPANGEQELSVPNSLLLLATMNTADRSLAMLDFAVRRRFRFLRVDPSLEALQRFYDRNEARASFASDLMTAFLEAVSDRDLVPGHSYFLLDKRGLLSDEEWGVRMIERVIHDVRPLFDEYRVEGVTLNAAKLRGTDVDLATGSVAQVRETLRAYFAAVRAAHEQE